MTIEEGTETTSAEADGTTEAESAVGTNDTPTLGGVSHTNPYTGEPFGATGTYRRGTIFAADGGEDARVDDTVDSGRLKDVAHTPPKAADGVQAVYDRGHENR